MYPEYYASGRYIRAEGLQTRHFEPIQYLVAGSDQADLLTHYLADFFKSKAAKVDETLSFDHPTGTTLHYIGASRLVSKCHMFPPVDVMIALSDSSMQFEEQIIENGTIIVDKSRVNAMPKRADLDRLMVPSWQITRDLLTDRTGRVDRLETAAVFGVALSLHSPFFDQFAARRAIGTRESEGPIVLKAVRRGYDWAQEEKHIKGLTLLGRPFD